MTFDDAFAAMANLENALPETAMRWSLEHWDEAGPRFLELLDRYADGADRSKDAESVLFFAVHMMAEKAERAAFPGLCRLLRDSLAAEAVLGDATTENLSGILISTFDGDLAALQGVVEAEDVDVFIRSVALDAVAYLTGADQVTEAQMRTLLMRLGDNVQKEENEVLALSWVNAVSSLGYEDLTPQVQALFKRNEMLAEFMEYDDFEEDLEATQFDPDGMAGFARDGIEPLTDAIGSLEGWTFGNDAEDAVEEPPLWDWRAPVDSVSRTVTNPLRGVGRNDPCPCGSGKKYKKCCLV